MRGLAARISRTCSGWMTAQSSAAGTTTAGITRAHHASSAPASASGAASVRSACAACMKSPGPAAAPPGDESEAPMFFAGVARRARWGSASTQRVAVSHLRLCGGSVAERERKSHPCVPGASREARETRVYTR